MTQPCEAFRDAIERQLSGETTGEEEARLRAHCATCRDCAELCAVDRTLRAHAATVEPDANALAEVRRAVLREARRAPEPAAGGWGRLLAGAPWLRVATIAGAASLLLAAGFAAGRRIPTPGDPLARALQTVASVRASGPDPLESPFTFANVRADVTAPGRVRLEFDVSTHLALERPATDPLVGEVVAQTLLAGASPVDGRLRAIAVSEQLLDTRVREALVHSAEGDPNAAVRLKAFAELARRRGDPIVQGTALRLLEGDGSVQLRLAAIDYLTGNGVDRGALRRAIAAADPEARGPLLVRASQYLQRN